MALTSLRVATTVELRAWHPAKYLVMRGSRGSDASDSCATDNDIRRLTHMFESLVLSCSQSGSTRMEPSGKTMVGTL